MIKILHIIDSNERGGAELMLSDTLQNKQPGLVQKIFSLSPTVKNGIHVDFSGYGVHGILNLIKTIWALMRTIREIDFDILHAHLPISGLLVKLAAPHCTSIIHVHNELSKTDFGKHKMLSNLERRLSSGSTTYVFVSEQVKQDYVTHFRKISKSHIVYNCVQEEFYNLTPTKNKTSSITRFIAVGNWKAQKNMEFLVSLFESFCHLSLTIYTNQNRPSIEGQIGHALPHNVHIVTHQKLTPTIYKQYDAYISASDYEGFGNATLEAGLSGLPLFLSAIPTYKELFGDVATFYFPKDIQAAKIQLTSFLSTSFDIAHQVAWLNSNYAPTKRATQLSEIYNLVCNEGTVSHR